MAKNVRWTVPFQSVKGVNYRINIYDADYTGTPITLQGADGVFVTTEGEDKDIFSPIRTQTATLRLIDTDGSLIETLAPEDNLSRPIELVRVDNSRVEWYGFLSCEAYSQQYTARTKAVELSCKSILEAMDSVEMDIDTTIMFNSILAHMANAFRALMEKADIDGQLRYMYVDKRYFDALKDKKIYNNSYFSAEELMNGENITYEVHSTSAKELLANIAQFFGCIIREHGKSIYMIDAVKTNEGVKTLVQMSITRMIGSLLDGTTQLGETDVTISGNKLMSSYEWMGEEHQKSLTQGARRVKITTALKSFDGNLSLPDTPYASLVSAPLIEDFRANTNDEFYSLASYKYMRLKMVNPGASGTFQLTKLNDIATLPYAQSSPWTTDQFRTFYDDYVLDLTRSGTTYSSVMAYFALWKVSETETLKGLFVNGFPKYLRFGDQQYRSYTKFSLTEDNALYTQTTALPFAASTGWLNVNAVIGRFRCIDGTNNTHVNQSILPALTISVQLGDKYWSKTEGWCDEWCSFELDMNADGTTKSNKTDDMDTTKEEGYFIPIPWLMVGFVTIKIYHEMKGWYMDIHDTYYPVCDVLLTKFDVEYVAPDKFDLSDRSSNSYLKYTGRNFSDTVDYSLKFSSDFANDVSSSMLWDDETTPTKLISLDGEMVRPEVDLLDRVVDYYKDARRTLTLTTGNESTEHPVINVTGYDNKNYNPTSASIDWQADKSDITLFEIPNED